MGSTLKLHFEPVCGGTFSATMMCLFTIEKHFLVWSTDIRKSSEQIFFCCPKKNPTMTPEVQSNIHQYLAKHVPKARLARIVAEMSECMDGLCDTELLSDSVHQACAESIYKHTISQAGKDFIAKDGADAWPPIKSRGLYPQLVVPFAAIREVHIATTTALKCVQFDRQLQVQHNTGRKKLVTLAQIQIQPQFVHLWPEIVTVWRVDVFKALMLLGQH
jgi:hypothetical protein